MRKGQRSVLRERAAVAILQEGVSRSWEGRISPPSHELGLCPTADPRRVAHSGQGRLPLVLGRREWMGHLPGEPGCTQPLAPRGHVNSLCSTQVPWAETPWRRHMVAGSVPHCPPVSHRAQSVLFAVVTCIDRRWRGLGTAGSLGTGSKMG